MTYDPPRLAIQGFTSEVGPAIDTIYIYQDAGEYYPVITGIRFESSTENKLFGSHEGSQENTCDNCKITLSSSSIMEIVQKIYYRRYIGAVDGNFLNKAYHGNFCWILIQTDQQVLGC